MGEKVGRRSETQVEGQKGIPPHPQFPTLAELLHNNGGRISKKAKPK